MEELCSLPSLRDPGQWRFLPHALSHDHSGMRKATQQITRKLPKLLAIVHWPNKPHSHASSQWVCSTVLPRTAGQQNWNICTALETDYQTLPFPTVWLDLFVSQANIGHPARLSALPVSAVLIHPYLQGNKSLWLRKPGRYFLPEEGTDHHSGEIKRRIIKQYSQRVSKHLLSQQFSCRQPRKFLQHCLSPFSVPRTLGGAGLIPTDHTLPLL